MYLLAGVLTLRILDLYFITVAGQCWIFTSLSPLLQVAVPHLNQAFYYRTHLRSFTGGNRTDIGGGGRVRLEDDCVRQEFLA